MCIITGCISNPSTTLFTAPITALSTHETSRAALLSYAQNQVYCHPDAALLTPIHHYPSSLIPHPTSTSTSTSTKPSTPSLQTLDRLRYHTIPQRLAARKKAAETSHDPGNGAYLEKEEVEDLVRWKLYVAYRSTALGLWPCPPPPHGE